MYRLCGIINFKPPGLTRWMSEDIRLVEHCTAIVLRRTAEWREYDDLKCNKPKKEWKKRRIIYQLHIYLYTQFKPERKTEFIYKLTKSCTTTVYILIKTKKNSKNSLITWYKNFNKTIWKHQVEFCFSHNKILKN